MKLSALSPLLLLATGQPAFAQQASKIVAGVRVFPGDVSVCPTGDGDCHLTLVDNVLCTFLAQLFDPKAENWTDSYNCSNKEDGVYKCVNVLGARRLDSDIKTNYTYPYLLELAADYEAQLDRCLPGWTKTRSVADSGQSITYARLRNRILLAILPFDRDGKSYDRLTMEVRVGVQ